MLRNPFARPLCDVRVIMVDEGSVRGWTDRRFWLVPGLAQQLPVLVWPAAQDRLSFVQFGDGALNDTFRCELQSVWVERDSAHFHAMQAEARYVEHSGGCGVGVGAMAICSRAAFSTACGWWRARICP